jgi:hypothetical protein
MKIRRAIAFVLCLAVLSVTGCSKNADSSKTSTGTTAAVVTDSAGDGTKAESRTEPATAAVPAEVPAGRKGYQTPFYSFDVDEGLTVSNTTDKDDGVWEYTFSGGDFLELEIQGAYNEALTPVAAVKYDTEDFDEKDNISDFELEVIENAPYECAAYFYTDERDTDSKGNRFCCYQMAYQSVAFTIEASYSPENEEKVREELGRIISSVRYISDKMLPTEPQDYDTPYLTLHYDPKWAVSRDKKEDLANGALVDVKFCYAQTDDPQKYLFPNMTLRVENNGGKENAFELAGNQYKNNSKSKMLTDVKMNEDEILGHKAELVSSIMGKEDKAPEDRFCLKTWYFDCNGMVYIISVSGHLDSESDQQDIDELLSGLTIKELSDEEIAADMQRREDARYTAYTFRGASFEVDSRLKAKEFDDTKRNIHYDNYGNDLYIYFWENDKAEDRIEFDSESVKSGFEDKKAERKASLKTSREHIGGYELKLLSYIEPANYSHSSDERIKKYYYNNGNDLWVFEFDCYEGKESESDEIIKAFFESLKFGEAQ